jgi:exodeoxyribonuclease VII large subunit
VIHDICRVAFRRGGANLLLAPAQVQGVGAAESICHALVELQRVAQVDVIIVGRGGGSADDLGAFNDEDVVRAVAACKVPIVSAVGHDVDFTLVDFAADARAATPSQAAEMVVPDRRARRDLLARTTLHLARAMHGRLTHGRVALGRVAARVADPRLVIAGHQQTLDDRWARLASVARAAISSRRENLARARQRLAYQHPRAVLSRDRAELRQLRGRLESVYASAFERRASAVQRAVARLDALSPLRVLARGYAVATREDGRAVRSVADALPGDVIHVRVSEARIDVTVTAIEPLTKP